MPSFFCLLLATIVLDELQPVLIVVQLLVVAVVTFVCAHLPFFRGLRVASFGESLGLAIVFALIYGALNWLAAPLNWLTLGMFGVVVAAVALELADFFIEGVQVDSWGWALLLALVLAITNWLAALGYNAAFA